ncbi:AT-rich interactive domain-containing protein 1 [Punica granatum]|uniref:AT-rich interactive domain-containing protein 1 n=2 Tax=Punica granatum TaxID=22663 RepID=A0A6P8DN75_PUNGR|nr:AT-rich interactive domain-containing protein 1 [Punica granatum]XP_031393273.1 AT-rich interactive domain-containing protein 1 [Punica granatum]XP_031393274.1 AT-rich interactive domain-containing protein 1 [Punica granatum]XP_031393275.1 AT-rich interactive domain-containing protein 1 [Punica granatum]XP_031393276.1 AT-rich interactive domain-containing protein 1 [Punica granatum]XP_031393277.1 AT-rich interactive domain-containing protein 1 [Punica granatum]XP_031393278.1 AT-rich intera
MEFTGGFEESFMEFGGLNADVDLGETYSWDEVKSMGQELDESKMCVEDQDSLPFDSRKGVITSAGGDNLCDEGDAKSEVLEADIDKKCNSPSKRVHNEISEEYLVSSVPKRKKNVASSPDDEFVSVVADSEGGNMRRDDDVILLDPEVYRKEVRRPRKRDPFCRMLDWLNGVAKDPCHPAVGSLPERSKWKSQGSEELWKQVLLAREAISIKRHDDVASEPPNWQKIQKMHPVMYEVHYGSSYKFRDRSRGKARSSSGKGLSPGQACSDSFSSGTQSNLEKSPDPHMARTEDHGDGNITSDYSTADSFFCMRAQQKVPVGPQFQAKVPEWDEVTSESDSKWSGTRIWPLEKTEHRSLIERDPIGKGRQDSCGCQIQGSAECIRFHIAEKRMKLKLELGSAFFRLKLDKMGEEVELSWTEEEQNRFAVIVKSNPQSQYKCFWDHMFKAFRNKSREELVSYYFNVFLLKRRAYQNRFTRDSIDSDDDESETNFAAKRVDKQEIKPSSSIFYSPTKPNAKFR